MLHNDELLQCGVLVWSRLWSGRVKRKGIRSGGVVGFNRRVSRRWSRFRVPVSCSLSLGAGLGFYHDWCDLGDFRRRYGVVG